MNGKIVLRPVKKEDIKDLYNWRNDPVTLRNSFNSDFIEFDEHSQWFEKSLENPNRLIFIALKNNVKVGQVRFDIEKDIAEVDVTVDTNYRKKGLGSEIIKKGCEKLFSIYEVKSIFAKIKPENKVSINAFGSGQTASIVVLAGNFSDTPFPSKNSL